MPALGAQVARAALRGSAAPVSKLRGAAVDAPSTALGARHR